MSVSGLLKSKLVQEAWAQGWTSEHWVRELRTVAQIGDRHRDESISTIVDNVIQYTFCGSTPNKVCLTFLKDGMLAQCLPATQVINNLFKMPLGKRSKCYSAAIDIVDQAVQLIRQHPADKHGYGLEAAKSLSRAVFWLIENTIEVFKALYLVMKDVSSSGEEDSLMQIVCRAQDIASKMTDTLSMIGKLALDEEEDLDLHPHVKDLCSMQTELISKHRLFGTFQHHIKEHIKAITKFHNQSPSFVYQDRATGHVPSRALHALLQYQVLHNLPETSSKIAGLVDVILRTENIPLDQLFTDVIRFGIHGLLRATSKFDHMLFAAFMFLKIPNILAYLDRKYREEGVSILFSACSHLLQFAIPLDDLDAVVGFNAFNFLLLQCHQRGLLDAAMLDQLCARPSSFPDLKDSLGAEATVYQKLIQAGSRSADLLKRFSRSPETETESLAKELVQQSNNVDNVYQVVALAANDDMVNFVACLLRMNNASVKCPEGSADTAAEARADLFNFSFLFLAYINSVFGATVFDSFKDDPGFFMTWRRRCVLITSQKLYSQAVLDSMLEPVMTAFTPPSVNASWDEYCWSAGMIIKELTQAHLCRHISTDVLQKVCEGFKTKRPALCICAVVWLCTQYRAMSSTERNRRTSKIIQLFKRPITTPRGEMFLAVINNYSQELEFDLQAANAKAKTSVTPELPKSESSLVAALLEDVVKPVYGPCFDQAVFGRIQHCISTVGPRTFARTCIRAILNCGIAEEAGILSDTCMAVCLVEPVGILQEVFSGVLVGMFYAQDVSLMFTDPQGHYVARFLSRVLAFALILYDEGESPDLGPRTAKVPKSSYAKDITSPAGRLTVRQRLTNALDIFLRDVTVILSSNQLNAVTMFIFTLLEQISMATACLERKLNFKPDLATEFLSKCPESVPKEVMLLLCDVSTNIGREKLAQMLCSK